MKYVKPAAEIINIENQDIIVASYCSGNNGSNVCIKFGNTTMPNSYEAMNCSGTTGRWCYQGLSWLSGLAVNGVTCTKTSGSLTDNRGNVLSTMCTQVAGAN